MAWYANPAVWSAIGSGITAAGSMLGLKGGRLGEGFQKRMALHPLEYMVADAKKAGIHPLAALGSAAGHSPMITSGNARGDALERIGQTITREAEARSNAKMADEIGRAQVRSLRAAAHRDEAQAQLALSESARITQGSNAQPTSHLGVEGLTIDGVPYDPKHTQWKGGGVAMEPPSPVWRQVRLMNGMLFNVPNQDVFEVPEGLGYLMYLLEQGKNVEAEDYAKSQGGSIWDIFRFNFSN